jgi:predicted DNA-binding protein
MSSQDLHIKLPEKLNERLEQAKEDTGLTKSEIARSGLLVELNRIRD